jgi:RHS repeat-associated protein
MESLYRRVSPDGIITTVAGNGTEGYSGDGGPATQAKLNLPNDVAISPDGSLYISDYRNNRIRRVWQDGIITTVAGNGTEGYSGDGGPATQAKLKPSGGVAVAPDGSLYIAEFQYEINHAVNSRIRRVGTNGIITTVAGVGTSHHGGDGGPAVEAHINGPFGIAVAPDGSLYIADTYNYCVRRVGPDGIITTVAGIRLEGGHSGDGGPAAKAKLSSPVDVEVGPDGSLYITDGSTIRRIGPDGIIATVAGVSPETGDVYAGYSGDGGPPNQARFYNPKGIAIGPEGILYIADEYNDRIRRVGYLLTDVLLTDLVIPAEDGSAIFIFDEAGRHKRTLNPITGSEIYTFNYDHQGRLTEIKDAFNNVTRIERDEQGNPTAIIAPGGQKTGLAVNENGYLSNIICPLLKEKVLTYDDGGLLKTFSDHKGNIYTFTYDELGRLVKDEDPAGGYTELSREELENGHEVSAKTAEGRVSKYRMEYLGTGGARRVNTDPLGGVTTTEIKPDAASEVTYPDGTVVTMVQGPDPRPGMGMGAPVTKEFIITTPAGLKSTVTRERTVEMDDPNNLLSVTQIKDTATNNGEIYQTTYDIDRDKTITVTSKTPEGRQIISKLDWYGRLIEEKTADLEPISYSYDGKGRMTGVSQGNQQLTYTWDDMNRITALEDAAGDKFHYEYNGADLLTKLTMPGGQAYAFGYDFNGNVTAITMPSGATHQLDYTAVDLPLSYTPPENNNGRYQKSYNRDRAVTGLSLPGGQDMSYQYDSQGRITGMQYGSTTSTFGYADNTDRISSIQRNPDGVSYGFSYDGSLLTAMSTGAVYRDYSYEYGNDFKLITSKLGADTMSLTYDKDGLVTGYGDFTINRGHSFGLPTEISDGVMSITYNYDNFGRMTDRTHKVNNQQVYRLGLDYGNTGLISQKDESVAGADYELHYEYDDNKQLTGVTGDRTETYTYDVNGNRLTGGAEYDVQDRLTKLGDITYEFNADGFLTRRGSDSFEYTAQGELVKATLENGPEVTYSYDGVGRRVARSVVSSVYGAPVTEHYLYGNPGNPFEVTAVRDSNGSLSQYYYDQVNCLFAIKKDSTWYYVATDQQGTPRVVSDANGQIVKVMEYDSFGKLLSDSNPDLQLPIGYAGGIADPETGLVHFGMRDYDPATGRWTARDPILFNGRQGNLYVYVSNNPVNLRDPSGLFCIGGSYYAGVGIGGQLCITGEGVSLCGEVGFGVGGGVEISPFGGLAETGTKIYGQAEATYMGVGPSVGLSLDNCGSLKFEGALKAGPFSQSASYDFLEGKWALGDLSVGGEKANMNNSWLESFKPKISASAKVAGQGCVRF